MNKISSEGKKIKKALVSIGFPEKEAEKQAQELNELVVLSIISRLVKERKEIADLSKEQFEEYLKENGQDEVLQQIAQEETDKVVSGYIDTLLVNLSDDEREKFSQAVAND